MCYFKLPRSVPAVVFVKRYRPDVGLLTSEPAKYDDELNPRIIAPDPFTSDECFDVISPEPQLLLTTTEDENTMNTSDNEPSSGLNARLRPRRSTTSSPNTSKAIRKPESKTSLERQKRTSTPSKASSTKPDDLANKSDPKNAPQYLCPFCDRKFASKQTATQHARRVHFSKQAPLIDCLFCNHAEPDSNDIIRHMVDSHPNQYFACLDCHTRFSSTSELAEHKLNVCEKQKVPYRSKLRQKVSAGAKKTHKSLNIEEKDFRSDGKDFTEAQRFNGVVISCELKPSQVSDETDIENNITTNLILPPSKNLGSTASIEKNAVIMLDDIQWNKRMPTNFSFHNTDADQILSRLGVVHRSPRTGESTKKDWLKCAEEATQRFEKCFDTSFYSKVASNVHENMSKFLDGSFNFNPDPDSIIKTRKSKNSVVINAAEGFPILLACEQFSRNVFDGYMPRALAPKHKWKWENDKISLNPDDIKHDTHVNNCIITLVSSLDIWTQLCMRRKFEDKFGIAPLEKKTEKQNTISKELKEILESRELPSSSQQVVKFVHKPVASGDNLDFPASLGLKPSAPTYDVQPAVLSGEWVRPRCYVCCACGAQTRDSRGLSSHISTQHPNAQVQYYEIVGELLLNADILKHLYVPPSQMSNRTRPLRGFRECTKCKKSISLEDLHQHMLDCAGDTPAVRRKCRYRPFGVRRRRTRLPDNTIRKKIRKDIRTRQTRQKTHMRPRPKIRTEVGDAETIRKMLADLPAKRHRVMVNPMNPILRPRRKLDKQRNKLIMKRRSSDILKNRKQHNLKRSSLSRTGSHSGDNDDNENKNVHKSDDENKPLKPKVKTMKISHSTRQSESLKRKVALNRARRRAQIQEQKATKEKLEQQDSLSASSSGQVEQISIDNTPQRIDVSSGPYSTREHSSRGRSNNRDDQRPGPSSQDSNTHNSYSPPQNVPLKHSIARLTADFYMHDKNMQFHHMYLMPPEGNEVTQHVPTGQQRLFENEAVVTKLDKPPLHFNPSGPVDPYTCHKSKQCNTNNNKRKGLNDCIAMLKNKAGQTAEPTETVPCNSDDRNCETAVTNQTSPNLDFQMNINYDTNTRPAEVFSRHPFIPDRFIEYHPESNLIVQNFADLPFHYLPSQRLSFDLPQPDNSRVDPRCVKPSKQKQNEGNQKTTRRRSTRAEKEQMKRQDLILQNSSVYYPVNVSTPSKITATRRASTQNVAVSTNTQSTKRRSSRSYNQSRKTVNDYQTEAVMSHQRPLEYHAHRISPETHLIELNNSEAYVEAQKTLQMQMLACAEKYLYKKQLAVSVDTNYAGKKTNTLSPKGVYTGSKQATSPGSEYINMKQASKGAGSSQTDKYKQAVSPIDSNYDKKKQASNTESINYFYKTPSVSSTEIAYNKPHASTSLKTDLINKPQTASYVEGSYVNKKAKAAYAENKACSKSFTNTTHAVVTTENNTMSRAQASSRTESNLVNNTLAQGVSETCFVSKNQTLDNTENNFTPKTSPVISGESHFITKKQAAASDSKKQVLTSESTFINKKQATTSDTGHVNKKQVALEVHLNKKIATVSESGFCNQKQASASENTSISNSRPVQTTESNITDKKSSDGLNHMYPENVFNNLPTIIPSAYPTMSANFEPNSSEMEAPLDLSKSAQENIEVSEIDEGAYALENYDNYETLDLSHKSLENNNDDNVDVVDLRVKINTLDMTSKLPSNDDMDSATDLTIKPHEDDAPTDLTVKKKTDNNAYEFDSQNVNYDDIPEFVQDLRKTHPEKQPIDPTSNINDSNLPTDLSGRNIDLPLDMVATKSPTNQTHRDNTLVCEENLEPADLSIKDQTKQNSLTSVANFMDIQPTIVHESTYVTKSVYDPNVHQPMFNMTTPLTTTNGASVEATIVTETAIPSNAVLSDSLVLSEKKQIVDGPVNNTYLNLPATTVMGSGSVVSSKASTVPLFTVANTAAVLLSSKYESTTPVYTLANECISMAKIELSAAPLSDVSLSVPNKPTANAAPLSTLTDTTGNQSVHQGEIHSKSSKETLSATINYIYNTQMTNDSNVSVEKKLCMPSGLPDRNTSADEHSKEKSTKVSDLDPETAKKIAMLPKELVEILGTMPVDHRNQLLNVLPQYVSTPASLSQNDSLNNSAASNTSIVNRVSSPIIADSDVKPALGYSPVSSSQSMQPPSALQPVTASVSGKIDDTKPISLNAINKNEAPIPRVSEVDGNTVIDLTEDEPVTADIKKIIVEPNENEIIPLNNLGGVTTNNKLKVNDQTASLRAVRIKAPSARNKSLSMDNNAGTKNSCQEPPKKPNLLYVQNMDTSVDKTKDLNKTLAIQQAEISSTQHNTTIAGHCKYPLAISPSSTEYSGDESSKTQPQPSPIPVNEIVTENKEGKTPIPKTVVTSSISKKVLNPTNVEKTLNNIIDNNTQAVPKASEVGGNDQLLISKSKESDLFSCEATNLDAAENRSVEDSNRCTKDPDHEDDSEDDISLASIIKQKLRDQLNVCDVNIQNKNSNEPSTKKKKEGKGKKVAKKIAHDDIFEEIPFKELKDIPVSKGAKRPQANKDNDVPNDISDEVPATSKETEMNKHSKRRPKRSRRAAVIPAAINIQKDSVQNNDKEINKENNVVSKFLNNKTINDSSTTVDVKGANKETPPRSHDIVNSEDFQNEVSKIKPKLKLNKEFSSDKEVTVRVRTLSDDMLDSIIEGQSNCKETKKKVEVSEPTTAETCVKEEENQTVSAESKSSKRDRDVLTSTASDEFNYQSETVLENCDGDTLHSVNEKDKKTTLKTQNDEEIKMIVQDIDVCEQISDIFDGKDDIVNSTPLRRSRRGKSLYLKSSQIDKDLYENIIEQKTPLTKKQLIFSKLRLDEETPKVSEHSTPETQNVNEMKLNDTPAEKTIDISQLKKIENPCETNEEKAKGTKRRINTPLMKKSKKKKSLEEQHQTNNLDNIDCSSDNSRLGQNISEESQLKSSTELNVNSNEQSKEIVTTPYSPVLSSYKNNSDKIVISTEKRKSYGEISFDLSQSSTSKKCKMTKANKNKDAVLMNVNSINNKSEETATCVPSETKTACYNLQVPARRGRSKSVIVKSSNTELYDPYDIDLEDMAEQSETFKRNHFIGKHSKNKIMKSGFKESDKLESDDHEINQTFDTQKDENNIDQHDGGDIVDSDDSSKSDVPLKCYLNKKEKNRKNVQVVLIENESSIQQEEKPKEEDKDIKSNEDKPSLTDVTVDIPLTEAEQLRRSENFLQIFGFFSEKQPRKSNLLASKKISETINITNESDDTYFGFKSKKNKRTENKKASKIDLSRSQSSTLKKVPAKRGRKKQVCQKMLVVPRYCKICKKEFRRSDNYLRHTMSSLLHLSKLADTELSTTPKPFDETPNYLIAYKINLERYKILLDRLAVLKKRNAKAAAKIRSPTYREIILDIAQTIEELKATEGVLRKDKTVYLSCCKLFKGASRYREGSELYNFKKAIDEEEAKLRECIDDDVDSLTAQSILESEEIRQLENELISGFKEAAMARRDAKLNQHSQFADDNAIPHVISPQVTMPQVEIPEAVMPLITLQQVAMSQLAMPQIAPKSPDIQNNQVVQEEPVAHMARTPELELERSLSPDIREETEFHQLQEGKSKENNQQLSSPIGAACNYENMEDYDVPAKSKATKVKKHIEVKDKMYPEVKEKMYPDVIEDIDMFEDKFDKIKRKSRSQAAAAKQPQPVIERTPSYKGRKKSEKKKSKKNSKKAIFQNTQVPTKGALKGFDGIKVSIPTSDINLSSIVPAYESSKKKKKSGSKRKRDKKASESSDKYDSDHRVKDNSCSKKVDVYEFMDNEDAELFEFRPSTLMERFKNISYNKDMPSTSRMDDVAEDDNSSDTASDGDDFVYMSDDYVCSDDETENSLMSCEISNAKHGNDIKKIVPQKRKDVLEKNAVMGKIFKHNAVRSEKKPPTIKDTVKPKANLDQLFDSLLEEEQNSSLLNSEAVPSKDDHEPKAKCRQSSKYDRPYDQMSSDDNFVSPQEPYSSSSENINIISSATLSKRRTSSPVKHHASRKHNTKSSNKYEDVHYGPSTSKQYFDSVVDYGPSTSKKYDNVLSNDYNVLSPKKYVSESPDKYDEKIKHHETKTKKARSNSSSSKHVDETLTAYDEDIKSPASKPDEGISTSYDYNTEIYDQSMLDDTGVARHRARRKCTVGKQNILSEHWSSESELDGGPPRPRSAESVISCVGRKKKGRKKEGHHPGGRRGNNRHVGHKKHDTESRVIESRSASVAASDSGIVVPEIVKESTGGASVEMAQEPVASTSASDVAAAAAMPAPATLAVAAVAGPSGVKPRRSASAYWSAESGDEPEHVQQHGWIVGDSHKKLVTMLAHAKGRKRNDDKRHLVE